MTQIIPKTKIALFYLELVASFECFLFATVTGVKAMSFESLSARKAIAKESKSY